MYVVSSTAEMARKQRSKGRQVHPTGPLDTVGEPWKNAVRDVMKQQSWTQRDLAEKIPVSPASITNMFKPGPRQIRFKRRIEELCGWSSNAKLDAVLQRVASKFSRLSVEQAELVDQLVESLATKP